MATFEKGGGDDPSLIPTPVYYGSPSWKERNKKTLFIPLYGEHNLINGLECTDYITSQWQTQVRIRENHYGGSVVVQFILVKRVCLSQYKNTQTKDTAQIEN